ncbi:MAG TPA: hypothetical protein VHD63_27290 [Ktedonobacteraceae bacterium]|nr:hypothetical protein [Ktedonobacteraceae bacterium]
MTARVLFSYNALDSQVVGQASDLLARRWLSWSGVPDPASGVPARRDELFFASASRLSNSICKVRRLRRREAAEAKRENEKALAIRNGTQAFSPESKLTALVLFSYNALDSQVVGQASDLLARRWLSWSGVPDPASGVPARKDELFFASAS